MVSMTVRSEVHVTVLNTYEVKQKLKTETKEHKAYEKLKPVQRIMSTIANAKSAQHLYGASMELGQLLRSLRMEQLCNCSSLHLICFINQYTYM